MKHLDEYRDPSAVRRLADAVVAAATRPWTIMEVCGGQTHGIVRFGLDQLLPPTLSLVHGPGCPVCVTPISMIDVAISLAGEPRVILCSYGDMLRVPGTKDDLLAARARGGDVRVVYSPLDAVKLARSHPDREVVLFAVGFETTAPATALAVLQADRLKLSNFSVLCAHVRVPPAMEAILRSPANRVQGFLAAGHVCTVMGSDEYKPLARRYGVPIVVTGFEPLDILRGVLACVRQLEGGEVRVENRYERAVRPHGNPEARRWMIEVFAVVDRSWRGMGTIPASGFALRPKFAAWDAARRFGRLSMLGEADAGARHSRPDGSGECISGLVLQGAKKPSECSAFGTRCTPERPLGAPMVSSEGACAAYYRYRRLQPAKS